MTELGLESFYTKLSEKGWKTYSDMAFCISAFKNWPKVTVYGCPAAADAGAACVHCQS